MGKITELWREAVRKHRAWEEKGRNECAYCEGPLPANAPIVNGQRMCSDECVYQDWLQSFV